MNTELKRTLAAVAAGVLLVPAAAQAKPGGEKGHGNGNGHGNGHAKHGALAPAVTSPAAEAPETAPEAEGPETAEPVVEPAPVKKLKVRKHAKGAKTFNFLFRGTVVSVDDATGSAVVAVTSGNAFSRRFRGQQVTFDLTAAKLAGVETDGVAGISLGDVVAGDRVMVQARLPRTAAVGGAAIAARKLVDHAFRAPVAVDGEDAPVEEGEPTEEEPTAPVVDPAPAEPAV